MDCKQCGTQLPEEELLCPACGADNTAVPEESEAMLVQEQPGEVSEEALCEVLAQEQSVSETPKKTRKDIWQIASTVVICLALLAIMFIVVISSSGKTEEGKRPVNTMSDMFTVFRKNDINCRSTFSVSEKKAVKKADDVVATIGDYKLTNGQLQIFYWGQVKSYLSNYGAYSFDYSKPLSEQYYSEEENKSWEQYFLEVSIESWRRYVLLNILATQEGVALSSAEVMETLNQSVEEEATQQGYESAEVMVKALFGNACTKADYINYILLYDNALTYFEDKYDSYTPTREEVSAYYDQNKELFEYYDLAKEDVTLVDVRHILIQLEDVESTDSQVNYTDEQWEQCKQQAQAVLDKWLETPTQENFAALAAEHSKDPGSVSVGGLYTDVAEGQMVTEFNAWIFDPSRKPGDTGLVKTVFGYHIMYFVGSEVTDGQWYQIAETQLASEYLNKLIEDAGKSRTMEVNYKKIALLERTLA